MTMHVYTVETCSYRIILFNAMLRYNMQSSLPTIWDVLVFKYYVVIPKHQIYEHTEFPKLQEFKRARDK